MTLERDYINYVRKYHKCQLYSDKIDTPPSPLFNLTSLWPFTMWGIDLIWHINPEPTIDIGLSLWLLTTLQNR